MYAIRLAIIYFCYKLLIERKICFSTGWAGMVRYARTGKRQSGNSIKERITNLFGKDRTVARRNNWLARDATTAGFPRNTGRLLKDGRREHGEIPC